MAKSEIDELSGMETTGHEWDGIRELNTPLPRWWLWTYYACIIWAAVYCVLYPAWPLVTSATKGVLGYSSRAEVAAEMVKAKAAQSQFLTKISAMSLGDIRKDQGLMQFAIAGGRSAFAVNCSQCHGTNGVGAKGYPNLNDDDWLWEGTLPEIYKTIAHGIRFEADENTRLSAMPAFGKDDILKPDQIDVVADFVLSLSGLPHDAAKAKQGQPLFVENCAPCHGPRGKGDRELGAALLNDAIWLYGKDKATIVDVISNARNSVMPAWQPRLDDATMKQLAIYVHALGGGE